MKDKKHITIKIAGQAFDLDIDAQNERSIRRVEHDLNKTWAKWCCDFPNRDPLEVLAMVAFQYARHYYGIAEVQRESERAFVDLERQLDDLLLNVK